MVGGSSNLRHLREKMQKLYGDKIFPPDETMWNVGQGAAWLSMKQGNYYTNQKIDILLSEGSFELLSRDLKINDTKKICHFGIVDSNKAARVIFGGCPDIDNSSDKYRVLNLPAYKFLQEVIILETEVDEDLVFVVKVKSNMRSDEFSRFWIYTRLKFYYKLDDEKEESN
jgi:hypothetical protein